MIGGDPSLPRVAVGNPTYRRSRSSLAGVAVRPMVGTLSGRGLLLWVAPLDPDSLDPDSVVARVSAPLAHAAVSAAGRHGGRAATSRVGEIAWELLELEVGLLGRSPTGRKPDGGVPCVVT